jgi:hypothetical protein
VRAPKLLGSRALARTKSLERKATAKAAPILAVKRKNPRVLQAIQHLSPAAQEEFLEKISPEEAIKLFDQSYPSDLVNLLLGLKKSTCRRLFEIVTAHRRKAYLEAITLYYYKDYLTNPLPLEIGVHDGRSVPNYYALVGMARDASRDEIENASRLLLRAFQPECFAPADRKMGDLRYREIKSAFDRLLSHERRGQVDRLLPSINYIYPKRSQSWFDMVLKYS